MPNDTYELNIPESDMDDDQIKQKKDKFKGMRIVSALAKVTSKITFGVAVVFLVVAGLDIKRRDPRAMVFNEDRSKTAFTEPNYLSSIARIFRMASRQKDRNFILVDKFSSEIHDCEYIAPVVNKHGFTLTRPHCKSRNAFFTGSPTGQQKTKKLGELVGETADFFVYGK